MEAGQQPKFQTGQQPNVVNPTIEIAKSVIEGKPPSNEILTKAIDTAKEALEEEISQRQPNAPEIKLAKDAEAFLEVSKKLINEKNSNEQVQKFLLESVEAGKELAEVLRMKALQNAEKLNQADTNFSQQATEIIESMKSVATQLVESYEFRNLLNDLTELVQHILEEEKEQAQATSGDFLEQLQTGAQQLGQDIKQGNIPIDEQKRQELINNFADLTQRIHASPEFKRAINGLFSIVEQLAWVAEDVSKEVSEETRRNPHMRALWADGKEIVASFAGGENVDKMVNHLWELYMLMKDDYPLKKYMGELKAFVLSLIENPQLLQEDKLVKLEADRLYDESRRWLNNPKYQRKIRELTNDLNAMWEAIKEDELRKEFAEKTKLLAEDLVLDESGKPNLSVTLAGMNRFRTLLAPILRKSLENIPVPPFSGSNPTYDWEVQGLLLNGREIIPDQIQVRVWGDADIALTDRTASKALTYITVWIRNIVVHAKDLRFHFHRKSFPSIDNRGVADVGISGDNWIKVTWRIEVDQATNLWLFTIQEIDCHVDKMKIKIKEATHNWLNKIISATLVGSLKRMVESKVKESVHEGLSTIGQQLDQALRNKE